MPGAAIFIATMHQPTRFAGSAAASTPFTGTQTVVLYAVATILGIISAWAFLQFMRAQDREMAELAKRYGYDEKPKTSKEGQPRQ